MEYAGLHSNITFSTKKKSTHDISFVLLPKSVVSFHIVVLGVSKTQRVPVKSALKI